MWVSHLTVLVNHIKGDVQARTIYIKITRFFLLLGLGVFCFKDRNNTSVIFKVRYKDLLKID